MLFEKILVSKSLSTKKFLERPVKETVYMKVVRKNVNHTISSQKSNDLLNSLGYVLLILNISYGVAQITKNLNLCEGSHQTGNLEKMINVRKQENVRDILDMKNVVLATETGAAAKRDAEESLKLYLGQR